MKSWAGPRNEADLYVQQLKVYVWEKSVWLGGLMIVNFLITLDNETFFIDDGNCIHNSLNKSVYNQV